MDKVLFCLAFIFLIGALDDLIIDLAYWLKGLRVRKVNKNTMVLWRAKSEKALAILIPAWKESAVLEAMVSINRKRIRYANYRFFIGVYPNDPETLAIAKSLEQKHPELVSVVVTDRPGPTSKAHCLNCILSMLDSLSEIAEREGAGWKPDLIAIHDAEDVIHPDAFTAINVEAEGYHFLQVPIFSLPVNTKEWVAGTYLDEFAEIHTKELPARVALQMPIPSAGVGTFFDWKYFQRVGRRLGYWFDEKNLTEDYEISYRMARLGARQKFVLLSDPNGEIIATREYFPARLGRSVRQKTRWTTGIALQSWERWGWFGILANLREARVKDIAMLYALWRDRKSLWSNPLSLFALGLVAATAMYHWVQPMRDWPVALQWLLFVNTSLIFLRLVQRAYLTQRLYGYAHGLLAPLRYLLSLFINGASALLAIKNYIHANIDGSDSQIKWDKTEHKFPTYLDERENFL